MLTPSSLPFRDWPESWWGGPCVDPSQSLLASFVAPSHSIPTLGGCPCLWPRVGGWGPAWPCQWDLGGLVEGPGPSAPPRSLLSQSLVQGSHDRWLCPCIGQRHGGHQDTEQGPVVDQGPGCGCPGPKLRQAPGRHLEPTAAAQGFAGPGSPSGLSNTGLLVRGWPLPASVACRRALPSP